MPVSMEAVMWGFRLLLGREADSEKAIIAHMGLDDEQHLAEVLITSVEFANKQRFAHLITLKDTATAQPDVAAQGRLPGIRLFWDATADVAALEWASTRPVSKGAVVWGFRLFFGREPDSDETVATYLELGNLQRLAEALITSPEFLNHPRFAGLIALKSAASIPSGTAPAWTPPPPFKILLLGNCQAAGLAKLMQAMADGVTATSLELTAQTMSGLHSGELDLSAWVSENDLILLHPHAEIIRMFEEGFPAAGDKVRRIPSISFSAFHPDLVYIRNGSSGHVIGPMGEYQSSIAFYGWRQGLSVAETVRLFAEDVFEALGFFDYWNSSAEFLSRMETATGLPLTSLLQRWTGHGCWMHSVNHPKLFVLADVAQAILAREGIATLPGIEQFLHDDLADGPVWPVYPDIGRRLGIAGHYRFQQIHPDPWGGQAAPTIGLEAFVQASFSAFASYPREDLTCDRLDSSRYRELGKFLDTRQTPVPPVEKVAGANWLGRLLHASKPAAVPPAQAGNSPYQGLPDRQFWRRAVERLPMEAVDPVENTRFSLAHGAKVATAGSCFAQHLARILRRNGFNHYVAESADGFAPEEAKRRNFGVFSARYGNIYTAAQLLQLFDRAYGVFTPAEAVWARPDGRLADPFRPQIEPDGFASAAELAASAAAHFAAVREMFENLDVFVFTLGLTEAWRHRADGAVYPVAPGVVAGNWEPNAYEFVNFGVADVVADLLAFIDRLLMVNPNARMILTVSPVPLIATYENRHVLVATTYSKSVLRVAADEIARRKPMCDYFPAYEIVTGHYNRGQYFEDDLRSIKPAGVEHVMRVFVAHYAEGNARQTFAEELLRENALTSEVICDEEAIDASSRGA